MCGVKGRVRNLVGEVDEAFRARKGPSCLWRQGSENPLPVDPDTLYLAPPSIPPSDPAWLWDKGLSPSTKPSQLLQASSGCSAHWVSEGGQQAVTAAPESGQIWALGRNQGWGRPRGIQRKA